MKATVDLDKVLDLVREHQIRLDLQASKELYRSREILQLESQAVSKLYDDIRRAAE